MVITIIIRFQITSKEKNLNKASRLERIPSSYAKNNNSRNRAVYSQSKDLLKWKKSRKYGKKQVDFAVETVFSSIKRTYGEHVSAIKYQNMIKEMILKVSLYNLFRRMA